MPWIANSGNRANHGQKFRKAEILGINEVVVVTHLVLVFEPFFHVSIQLWKLWTMEDFSQGYAKAGR